MKKVITIILDDSLAKEIFDEYYSFVDFISIETQAEYDMKSDGWKTWDDIYNNTEVCEDCGNIECDCDVKI
jgi:hypothetical protein